MNTITKRAEWKREGQEILSQLLLVEKSNNPALSRSLEQRFADWEAAGERLEFEESRKAITGKYASLKASGGDLGTGPRDGGVLPMGATGRGKDVAPLAITKKDARDAYEAVKRGQNYIIQAKDATTSFSTVDNLLVAQQAPGIVPEIGRA